VCDEIVVFISMSSSVTIVVLLPDTNIPEGFTTTVANKGPEEART